MRRALVCLALVLLVPACKDHKATVSQGEPYGPTPPVVVPSTKPVVKVPPGPAPSKLVRDDLIVGTGAFAVPGQTVTVNYVGVHFKGGKEFASSWTDGQKFTFTLGNEEVIPGWDGGVVGMRVGGRRMLVVPPDLGYGAEGRPPTIAPNETLVFVIDLVSVSGRVAGGGNPSLAP